MLSGVAELILIIDSEIGLQGSDRGQYTISNIACEHFEMLGGNLYVGDFNVFDINTGAWPNFLLTGDGTFWVDCDQIIGHTASGNNRYVIVADEPTGGFSNRVSLVNRGVSGGGGFYWANSSDRRLRFSRGSHRNERFWQPHRYGTGPGTASNNHPADPTGDNGARGETMISDGGGLWTWNQNATSWVQVQAHA